MGPLDRLLLCLGNFFEVLVFEFVAGGAVGGGGDFDSDWAKRCIDSLDTSGECAALPELASDAEAAAVFEVGAFDVL